MLSVVKEKWELLKTDITSDSSLQNKTQKGNTRSNEVQTYRGTGGMGRSDEGVRVGREGWRMEHSFKHTFPLVLPSELFMFYVLNSNFKMVEISKNGRKEPKHNTNRSRQLCFK